MKDQYVADINDYIKYSVLRAIQAIDGRSLLVCWMLTANDNGSDGAKISYLRDPDRYRDADPELFDALKALVGRDDRSTRSIEELRILPGATFCRDLLGDTAAARAAYMAAVHERLQEHDIVFFDPDNGLSVPSVPMGKVGSSRYLDCAELLPIREVQAGVVVYQHFPRVPRRSYVLHQLGRLSETLPGYSALAVYSSHVAFLAATPESQRSGIEQALRLVTSRWRGALTFVCADG